MENDNAYNHTIADGINFNKSPNKYFPDKSNMNSLWHNNINKNYQKIITRAGDTFDQIYVENEDNTEVKNHANFNQRLKDFTEAEPSQLQYKYIGIVDSIKESFFEGTLQNNKMVVVEDTSMKHNIINRQSDFLVPLVVSTENYIQKRFPEISKVLEKPFQSTSKNQSEKINQIYRLNKENLFDIIINIILESLKIFDSKNLKGAVTQMITDEKAHSIKVILSSLLKDLDKTQKVARRSENKSLKNQNITYYVEGGADENLIGNKSTNSETQIVQEDSLSDILQVCNKIFLKSASKSSDSLGIRYYSEKNESSNKKTTNYLLNQVRNIEHNQLKKVLILSPFDELIKSNYSSTDRRLKAISKKMNCIIKIFGPLKAFDWASSHYLPRDKITYQCLIIGETKGNIEKCLKCIRETFPTTTMREVNNS